MDKLSTIAPGRLSALLRQGLSGHHPLFEPDAIREAFDDPEADPPVERQDAGEVGEALMAICREGSAARDAVAGLEPRARTALIRLYFRLLDKARAERRPRDPIH